MKCKKSIRRVLAAATVASLFGVVALVGEVATAGKAGNGKGGGGGTGGDTLVSVTISDDPSFALNSDGKGDYSESLSNSPARVSQNGIFFFSTVSLRGDNGRQVWIDLNPSPTADLPSPGFYDMQPMLSFGTGPDLDGDGILDVVDLNTLALDTTLDFGLRIEFFDSSGRDWTIVFGDYPEGAKFPCPGGSWAKVTKTVNGEGKSVWTIEADTSASACLLESVKVKGKSAMVERARIPFPFKITAIEL